MSKVLLAVALMFSINVYAKHDVITTGIINIDALVTKTFNGDVTVIRKPGGDGLVLLQALDAAPTGTFAVVPMGNYLLQPILNKAAYPVLPYDKYDNVLVIGSTEYGLVGKGDSNITLKDNGKNYNIGGMFSNNLCDIYLSFLQDRIGINYTYVPYRDNGQKLVDLEAGRTDMFCAGGPELYQQSKDPRFKVIRNGNVDNVHSGILIIAKKGTSVDQKNQFISEFISGFNKLDADSKGGVNPLMLTGNKADKFVNDNRDKWSEMIKIFQRKQGVK